MDAAKPVTVYYNSACPVCDAGIRGQRGRMAGCAVEWVDVHTNPDAAQDAGASLEGVRERLHVRAADGTLHVGDRAIAELLVLTPRWRWLGRLGRVLGWITTPLYNALAHQLYRWNRRRGHW